MPPGINGRYGVGGATPPAATPQGSPQAPAGGRPANLARPENLAARNPAGSAGLAPRQRMPQAWQPPALGMPAYAPAHAQAPVAAHFAEPPRVLMPRPPLGGSGGRASGRGGIMQAVRNTFQQIKQFPQQLHQLAQQASHYPPNTMQQAMQTAQIAIHGLQSMPPPVMPYMPQHASTMALGVPAFAAQPHPMAPPALGIPVGLMPPPPQMMSHHPAYPTALDSALQVQQSAQQLMAQAQAFDAAMVSYQVSQMNLQAQTVQNCMAQLQQVFQANQAMLSGAARPGHAAAYAGAAPHMR